MKKLLFILTKDDVGGAQKYVDDLAKNIAPEKFSVEILKGGKDIRWLSNTLKPFSFFSNDWKALFELKRIFKKKNPDIVHMNNSKAGVIGAIAAKWANKNIKVIFTAHGWVFQPGSPISFLRRWFYIVLHKIAALFQDIIITVSEYDRMIALRYAIAREEKLITVRNGIDFENIDFLKKDTARKEIISRLPNTTYKQQSSDMWIGSVGRLVAEKNYGAFIEAASQMDQKSYFFIVGVGNEHEALQKQIDAHKISGRFFLVASIPESVRYLKAFDIFVLPSVKEGLPYTIIEAMAAKIPIVATNVGGIPEVVKSHGVLVPPRSPADLKEALAMLSKNKETREKQATEALLYGTKHLTLSRMVEETEAVYRLALEK